MLGVDNTHNEGSEIWAVNEYDAGLGLTCVAFGDGVVGYDW